MAVRAVLIMLAAIAWGQVDFVPARYVSGALPARPALAVSGGEVVLDVSVSADGDVGSVEVLRTTPPFTEALVGAVRRWHFAPAAIDATPIDSQVLVAGLFSAPVLRGPTLGEPPHDVGAAGPSLAVPVATAPLMYPPRATGTATVIVEVSIGNGGAVGDTRIVVSKPGFDEAALAAARAWSFQPAHRDTHAVPTHVYLVCSFQEPVMTRF